MEEGTEKLLCGRILDINTKNFIDPFDPPAPGIPPTSSDQGQKPVCASHAVGKAVVGILDDAHYDCDQEKVIKTLIQNVQPDQTPTPIDEFHRQQVPIEVWKKEDTSKKLVLLKLWVQRQTEIDVKNWTGPKITDKQRKEIHMGLVGIWRRGTKCHAVYIRRCRKLTGIQHKTNMYCIILFF